LQETARLILKAEVSRYPVHISQLARDFVGRALTRDPAERPSAAELMHHAWLAHYFGGKVPASPRLAGDGAHVGMLRTWLTASW
jgi:serine/threonine protein kinase